MSDSKDLEVYVYRGNEGEKVPGTIDKLIVEEGVQELPDKLCWHYYMKEIVLSDGLIKIGMDAFRNCGNLLEITIGSTVQYIGENAFFGCERLAKVEFESTASSSHMLQKIDQAAFWNCISLHIIAFSSSLTSVGVGAFYACRSLIEANLSTTCVAEILGGAFASCSSLQTVTLPNTLTLIGNAVFQSCSELVTVVVPLDSQPIRVGWGSFCDCKQLANLVLPRDSTAEENSFSRCDLLQERYSDDSSSIVAGLIRRFDGFSIHQMCYDHSPITVEQLRKRTTGCHEEGDSLVDEFGMTPFHVLYLTAEPRIEMLDVLLESLPNQILKRKDANRRRPVDYLINNWTDGTKNLLQRTLQKSMIDQFSRWGTKSWMEDLQGKIQEIVAEDGKDQRTRLCNEAYAAFGHYENVEATAMLEMALWKKKLGFELTNDNSKGEALVDREECRFLSGSDVVIPHVTMFLNIPRPSSSQDN